MTAKWGFFKKRKHPSKASAKARKSGQTTAEYVFLLLLVVLAVKAVGGNLKTRLSAIMDAAFGQMQSQIDSSQ